MNPGAQPHWLIKLFQTNPLGQVVQADPVQNEPEGQAHAPVEGLKT